jgi:hypothetical protein
MAIDYNKKLLDLLIFQTTNIPLISQKIPYKIFFKIYKIILISKIKIKNFTNKIILRFVKKKSDFYIFNINLIDKESRKFTVDSYLQNKYCYYENFLDENSYKLLLSDWPANHFFNYSLDLTKYYKFGFKLVAKRADSFEIYNSNCFKNKAILSFVNLLIDANKFKTIIELAGCDEKNYRIYSFGASVANHNSYLIPHKDSIQKYADRSNMINFIYFIDGNDSDIEHSGGTSIYKDNEFQYPLLMPKTLKNSLLIYDSLGDFYHGFKQLKKNCFRKAITFQASRRDYNFTS